MGRRTLIVSGGKGKLGLTGSAGAIATVNGGSKARSGSRSLGLDAKIDYIIKTVKDEIACKNKIRRSIKKVVREENMKKEMKDLKIILQDKAAWRMQKSYS